MSESGRTLPERVCSSLHEAGDILDEESAVAWFYRLLRNAVIDHYRHSAAGCEAMETQSHETPECDPGFDAADLERTVCECINDLVP